MLVKRDRNKGSERAFRLAYIFFTATVILVIFYCLKWLDGFLYDYEASMPVHRMEEIFADIEEDCAGYVLRNSEITLNELETQEMLKEFVSDYYSGKKLSFGRKEGEYSNRAPVYLVMADEQELATVRLKNIAPPESSFDAWEAESVEVKQFLPRKYSVSAPASAEVLVNGVRLSERWCDGSRTELPRLKNIYYSGEKPYVTGYEFSLYCGEPEITANDFTGAECIAAEPEGGYDYAFVQAENEALRNELSDYILEAARTSCNYATNDLPYSALTPYINKDAPIYQRLLYAYTQFYAEHTAVRFENEKIKNLIRYDENNFSCDVDFDHYVTFKGKEFHFSVSYTFFFEYIDGKWLIGDQLNNSVSE